MNKLPLVIIVLLIITVSSYVHAIKGSKLMVILLDGFKWNYFDKPGLDLPGFNKIIKNGVHCENHGFVGNYMYDIKHKEKFLIWRNKPTIYNTYWWEDAEPVWITAMKQ
ncbi:hypothetical protein KUTeg_021287, partial [Tegillarca granosa]